MLLTTMVLTILTIYMINYSKAPFFPLSPKWCFNVAASCLDGWIHRRKPQSYGFPGVTEASHGPGRKSAWSTSNIGHWGCKIWDINWKFGEIQLQNLENWGMVENWGKFSSFEGFAWLLLSSKEGKTDWENLNKTTENSSIFGGLRFWMILQQSKWLESFEAIKICNQIFMEWKALVKVGKTKKDWF